MKDRMNILLTLLGLTDLRTASAVIDGIRLETLGYLQLEEKLIGVISHISALKERIPAQIQITPKSGGRSEISGPGCEKI